MSDEDRDIDVESDDDDDLSTAGQYMTQAEKRAHHNALERKRRDHIKESFTNLRDSIPTLEGEKCSAPKVSVKVSRVHGTSGMWDKQTEVDLAQRGIKRQHSSNNNSKASRAEILKQATEYITFMGKKNGSISQDVDDLKRQNSILDQQVRALERAKRAGTFADQLHVDVENNSGNDKEDTDTDNSDIELEPHARKKMRT